LGRDVPVRNEASRYTKKKWRITTQSTTTLEVGWNERGIIDDIQLIGPE
jgi:hypothetical protein